jgi:hypothetical protein
MLIFGMQPYFNPTKIKMKNINEPPHPKKEKKEERQKLPKLSCTTANSSYPKILGS